MLVFAGGRCYYWTGGDGQAGGGVGREQSDGGPGWGHGWRAAQTVRARQWTARRDGVAVAVAGVAGACNEAGGDEWMAVAAAALGREQGTGSAGAWANLFQKSQAAA